MPFVMRAAALTICYAVEEHMTLHIAAVGDWTRSLYQLVKEGKDEQVRLAWS